MTVTTADIEVQVDGGSNANIFDKSKYFYTFTPYKGNIQQVTGDCGQYEGVGIVLCRIGQDIIVPLYPSYLMPKNPQNTISPTAIKKYNEYRSVRQEALEWFKITNSEGRSVRVPTIRKKVNEEALDYIKIDVMAPTTKDATSEYISAAPDIKETKYNSQIIIPPTINHAFSKNEELDGTIVHRRLGHAMEDKISEMAKLKIMKDLPKRKSDIRIVINRDQNRLQYSF